MKTRRDDICTRAYAHQRSLAFHCALWRQRIGTLRGAWWAAVYILIVGALLLSGMLT